MSLINSSYFIGERNIPNVDYPDVGSAVGNLLNKYEPEYLKALLGYELFLLFEAGLAEATPAAKWTEIRNGIQFTMLDGRLTKWKGLVDTETFQSPIADYVYYWWLRNNVSQTAEMGEVRGKAENAVNVSPKFKMCKAWNDMVDKSLVLYEFLLVNNTVYPELQKHSGSRELRLLLTRINPYF